MIINNLYQIIYKYLKLYLKNSFKYKITIIYIYI